MNHKYVTMYKYIFISIFIVIQLCKSYFLTIHQYKSIIHLIKTNQLPTKQRNDINKLLYCSYEKWSIKIAYQFKQKHHYTCRNIPIEELIFYSKIGLYKSVTRYNGNTKLINYAYIYILHELYCAITDSYAMSPLPKSYRIQNKSNFTKPEKQRYHKLLQTTLYNDEWQINNNQNQDEERNYNSVIDKYTHLDQMKQVWNCIDTLDGFSKRIIHLKYDYEFNNIRSNKQISYLMCYSEEYVRKKIIKSMYLIQEKLSSSIETNM